LVFVQLTILAEDYFRLVPKGYQKSHTSFRTAGVISYQHALPSNQQYGTSFHR